CVDPADEVRFIGASGVLARSKDTRSAEYRLQAEDSYVRTEIETRGTQLYLNPLLRCDAPADAPPRAPAATRRTWLTGLVRAAGAAAFVATAWLLLFRRVRVAGPAIG